MKNFLLLITILYGGNVCRADLTKGWFYTDAFPYIWSTSSESWQYLLLTENKLWLYDFGDSKWSLLQSGQVLGTSDFEKGYTAKVREIQDTPANHGLFTQSYLESERTSSYNEGYQAGLASLTPSPISTGIAPVSLTGKEILGVSTLGQITRFIFASNGQNGTVIDASGSNSFDYFYEKTAPNTGTFSINTDTAILRGQIEFSSDTEGTFSFVHREFSTRVTVATHTGTFSME